MLCSVGDPPDGRDYVATKTTCGPLLILSPALKFGDPPNGSADFVSRSEVLPPPPLMVRPTSDFVLRSEVLGIP